MYSSQLLNLLLASSLSPSPNSTQPPVTTVLLSNFMGSWFCVVTKMKVKDIVLSAITQTQKVKWSYIGHLIKNKYLGGSQIPTYITNHFKQLIFFKSFNVFANVWNLECGRIRSRVAIFNRQTQL